MRTIYAILLFVFLTSYNCYAKDWLWTPESGKWISERDIEKRSARVRYEKARDLEQEGKTNLALKEYRRLVKMYPNSVYAPEAQYIIGLYKESNSDYYGAFKEYAKVVSNYPSYKRFLEIIERQYAIGNMYLTGEKVRVAGIPLLPGIDKSIEVYEHIVRSAPYSSYAPRAQFNVGEAYRKIKRYSAAIPEYQKVVSNYPDSKLVVQSEYYIGLCGYLRSLESNYDQTGTDISISAMKNFLRKFPKSRKASEVRKKLEDLLSRKAKKSFEIAEFYVRDKCEEGAIIYYQDVINELPGSKLAAEAEKRIDDIVSRPVSDKPSLGNMLASVPGVNLFVKKKGAAKDRDEWLAEKRAKKEAEEAAKEKPDKRIWEFWKKGKASEETQQVAKAEKKEPVKEEEKKESGKNFWEFWKKDKAAEEAKKIARAEKAEREAAAKADKKPAKQFWEFWKKEPKEVAQAEGISGKDGKLKMETGIAEYEKAAPPKVSVEPSPALTGYEIPVKQKVVELEDELTGEREPTDAEIEAELWEDEPLPGVQQTAEVVQEEAVEQVEAPAPDMPFEMGEDVVDEVDETEVDVLAEESPAKELVGDAAVIAAQKAVFAPEPDEEIADFKEESIEEVAVDDDEWKEEYAVPFEMPKEFEMARITDLKLVEADSGDRLVFVTNKPLSFNVYELKDPARLMIAMKSPAFSSLDGKIAINKAGVGNVRNHYRNKEETEAGWQVNAIVLDFTKDMGYEVSSDEKSITVWLK